MKAARQVIGEYGLYDHDVTIIKALGDNIIRLVNLSACRRSGLEIERRYSPKNTVNERKLGNNMIRAKTKVMEYALCNPWDYFCTFTIDGSRYDRYSFKEYYQAFAKFISNLNRSLPEERKIHYLLIPEMHIDGAWHVHGLLRNLPESELAINRNGFQTWGRYADKFGFMTISRIKDIDACSKYIMKYITKDMSKNNSALGCHIYYASNGLKKGEVLHKGKVRLIDCDWDYETEDKYCRIKTIDRRKQNFDEMVEVINETECSL